MLTAQSSPASTLRRSKEQDMMDAIRRGNFNPDAFKKPEAAAEEKKAKTETVEDEADAEEEVVVHDEI